MDENILEWLLSDDTPEVRLRTLKEYQKLSDDNPKVIECKSKLLQSKISEKSSIPISIPKSISACGGVYTIS